jgi:inorganic pyrophosphatase
MSDTPDVIKVVIEIPRGSRNKYEFDFSSGTIRLDRVLFSSIHYPTEYGFIPGTRGEDGDPLDVLVVIEEPTFPGCHMEVKPIGVLHMRDEKGMDEKILAVPVADPRFNDIKAMSDLPQHLLLEIENFFKTYKMLEGKETVIEGWSDIKDARRTLKKYMSENSNLQR